MRFSILLSDSKIYVKVNNIGIFILLIFSLFQKLLSYYTFM
jgi:hypothetical protein